MLLAAFAGALLAGTIGMAVWLVNREPPTPTSAANQVAPRQQTRTEPAKVWPSPKPEDFILHVKILEKDCFGSAGCNLTYKIEPAYTGPALEPGARWDVTYEITGGDDDEISTFEFGGTDTGYVSYVPREERISTPRSSSALKATVTIVSDR